MALLTSYQYYANGHWHDPASGSGSKARIPPLARFGRAFPIVTRWM